MLLYTGQVCITGPLCGEFREGVSKHIWTLKSYSSYISMYGWDRWDILCAISNFSLKLHKAYSSFPYIEFLYPRSTEGGIGVNWIHPDVCPSVCPSFRPSLDKVSRTFWKNQLPQLISYLEFTLMGWVSWPLYIFVFLTSFSALWWPNIWPKMGFRNFFKKLLAQLISYLAFTLWGESHDP